jgi:hypothetical protein
MATQRLTKKCFEVVDRTEMRKIAMKGMGLPAKQAYKLDNKGIIDWVFTNSKEVDDSVGFVPFTEVNLEEINGLPGGEFRQGVLGYLLQLQGFILKSGDKPVWPGDLEEEVSSSKEEEVEIPPAKKTIPIVPKEYGASPDKNLEEVAMLSRKKFKKKDLVVESAKSKVGFSKAKIGKNVAVKAEAPTVNLEKLEASVDELTGSISELALGHATQEENYLRLEKGLLYIINMLCEDGQEVVCLDQVPKPKDYITQ